MTRNRFRIIVKNRNSTVISTQDSDTIAAALDAARDEAGPAAGTYERIRISVMEWCSTEHNEGYKEIYFAYGNGLDEAITNARTMDAKSREGGGR